MRSGAVKCWGRNYSGQLGDVSTTDRLTPVDVVGLANEVTAVSAGSNHTCALLTSGAVKCWGRNFGLTPNEKLASGVVAISAGEDYSCALLTSGAVKCWGVGMYGQLGNNSTGSPSDPVDVVGLSSGVAAISAGVDHTCALLTSGGVKCWGYNSYGKLGDNSTTGRLTPVDVVGLSSGVTAIEAFSDHTCALLTSGGVKCWGLNAFGQLGDNSQTSRSTPVDVVGLSSGVTAISLGRIQTCALLTSGGVKCWGAENVTSQGQNHLTPVDVVGIP
jgi:alpha-tubulin suppressor-like RCC1 family protein